MISKEDIQEILTFSKVYREKQKEVEMLKSEMDEVRERILNCVDEVEKLKTRELELLETMKNKYNLTDNEIIQEIQKIVLHNE